MQINDFDVLFFNELDSTNNYAKIIIDKNDEILFCNKVIVADVQTEGRGAFENKWTSEKNLNLTFSIIICPQILAKNQFFISKVTSLALIEYFKNHNIEAKIKWPNDILIKNKKISGILIENSVVGNVLSNSIIGIGVNINQIYFPAQLNAVSLKNILKKDFDKVKELKKFLGIYSYYLNLCKNHKFGIINELYFQNLLGNNEYLTYKKQNFVFNAIIENIDEYGRLILKDKNEKKYIFGFKEVELLID